MKVTIAGTEKTCSLNDVQYGECCMLPNSEDVVYMRLETSQENVFIQKQESVRRKSRASMSKLLALCTGDIICVPVGTRVIPVDAEVIVNAI